MPIATLRLPTTLSLLLVGCTLDLGSFTNGTESTSTEAHASTTSQVDGTATMVSNGTTTGGDGDTAAVPTTAVDPATSTTPEFGSSTGTTSAEASTGDNSSTGTGDDVCADCQPQKSACDADVDCAMITDCAEKCKDDLSCIAGCICTDPGPGAMGADLFTDFTGCFNNNCITPICQTELANCKLKSECGAILECKDACTACDDACGKKCETDHASGLTSYNAWVACVLKG